MAKQIEKTHTETTTIPHRRFSVKLTVKLKGNPARTKTRKRYPVAQGKYLRKANANSKALGRREFTLSALSAN
jgi:hypothetical protein